MNPFPLLRCLIPSLGLIFLLGTAPAPTIERVAHTVISTDEPRAIFVEPILAADPGNPRHLVAAAMIFGGRRGSAVYQSTDGGTTWRRAGFGEGRDTVFPGGDPALTFDSGGRVYFATISPWRVFTSTDGGGSFGAPVFVPSTSADREFIAALGPGPDVTSQVVTIAKIPIRVFGSLAEDVLAMSRSTDHGRSFGPPHLALPPPDSQVLHVPSDIVPLPNGELLVGYDTWKLPLPERPHLEGQSWTVRARPTGDWGEPQLAAEYRKIGHPDEWTSSLGQGGGRLALGPAEGSKPGRLYLAFIDYRAGKYRLLVSASPDLGTTWETPVALDPDSPGNHSTPALAVDAHGNLAVAWNDRREDAGNRCFRTRITLSTDGGRSFLPSLAVGAPACPNGERPRAGVFEPLNPGHRFGNGGETLGLVTLEKGRFGLVFPETQGSTMGLSWAAVRLVEP